jgi:hypothetical protein
MAAINLFFYAYLWWLAVWFIHGTEGLERCFMVGCFVKVLVSPLEFLRPQWTVAINYIGLFAMATSLLAALSLLLVSSEVAERDSKTGPA